MSIFSQIRLHFFLNVVPVLVLSFTSWTSKYAFCSFLYQCTALHWLIGHVIPPDQLLPIALARGSSGLQLDFTYQSRAMSEMVNLVLMLHCRSIVHCALVDMQHLCPL